MVSEAEIAAILQEYHNKKLFENLTGPVLSFVFHLVILTLMILVMATTPRKKPDAIYATVLDMPVVELEREVIDDLDIEPDPTQEAPVPADAVTPADNANQSVNNALADVSDEAPQTDDNALTEEFIDFVKTESVMTFQSSLGGRTAAERKKLENQYGAAPGSSLSVTRALRWLAKVQNENGSWGSESPAHTGMALLVFLAHGETPLSETYGVTVQKAMRWLAVYATDSNMSAGINAQKAYGHGIATYAICESYAMTKIPFMQTAMERAVDVIIQGQQACGGFDYAYKKGDRWDLSVGGWQFQALKAARLAGSTHPGLKDALDSSVKFCRNSAYANGKFGYTTPGSGGNMTGVGTVALQLLGYGKTPQVDGALQTIIKERFAAYKQVAEKPQEWTEVSEKHLYGWYYDTQAVFFGQTEKNRKGDWKAWREVFEKVLIRAQNPEGYWETRGHIGGADIPGRVLATCFSALQLEVYYRYLNTYDDKKNNAAAIADGVNIDQVGNGAGVVIGTF